MEAQGEVDKAKKVYEELLVKDETNVVRDLTLSTTRSTRDLGFLTGSLDLRDCLFWDEIGS